MSSRSLASPLFIGRAAELGLLHSAHSDAANGQSRIALVGGEAGIGKTRLLNEFIEEARAAGTLVLLGGCPPQSAGELPYAPFVAALRELVRVADPQRLERALGSARSELARLVPDLAPGTIPEDSVGAYSRIRLFELVLAVFERLAETPVVLAIEDIHWADHSTRDLISYLARNLGPARVLLIATYRDDAVLNDEVLASLIVELQRLPIVTRIELGRFESGEVAAQLEAIIGSAPEESLVRRIGERADGNPFFIEELLAFSDAGGSIPPTLRDTLLGRLGGLPEDVLQVLRIAAVYAKAIPHDVLVAASGAAEPAVTTAIRSALANSNLVRAREADGYAFRHALVRELVETTMLPGERRTINARLAAAIERSPLAATETPVQRAIAVAAHWSASGDRARARPAIVAAALASERVYAFDEADRLFEQALETLGDGTVIPSTGRRAIGFRVDTGRDPATDAIELLRHAADTANLAGAPGRAVDRVREALAKAGPHDPRRTLLQERLARYLWDTGETDASLDAYETAVGYLPAEPSAERARVLAGFGRALMLAGRYARSVEYCELARSSAKAAGATLEEWQATNTLGTDLAFLGRIDEAVAAIAQARALSLARDPTDAGPSPSRIIERIGAVLSEAAVLERAGRLDESAEVSLRGEDLARQLGVARTLGGLTAAVAARELFQLGRWEEADELTAETLRRGVTGPTQELELHVTRARLLIARGVLDEAAALLDAAGRTTARTLVPDRMIARYHVARAELALWRRRWTEANDQIDLGLQRVGAGEDHAPQAELAALGVRVAAEQAEDARARRSRAEVTASLERAADLVGRALAVGASDGTAVPWVSAQLRSARAERSRAIGEPDPSLWTAAVDAWHDLHEPYAEAYARWREAEARLHAKGPRTEAGEALREAWRLAQAIGAVSLSAEIEALARRARLEVETAELVDTSTVPGIQPDEPLSRLTALGLSNREVEVLALVAEGRTNRQIADELFITEKTAGHHVSNILGKLGVPGRVEAAGVAHRAGLARPLADEDLTSR